MMLIGLFNVHQSRGTCAELLGALVRPGGARRVTQPSRS
jgi:hypothetical protein